MRACCTDAGRLARALNNEIAKAKVASDAAAAVAPEPEARIYFLTC